MPRINWDVPGSRIYETGVNFGVLYPPANGPGVPWNGLISVDESPNGGEQQPFYQDGVKYFQISAAEEYNATINAFSAPIEFALCDGIANLYAGLTISQQPRKTFGFCYRTLIGNDLVGEVYGYNLHLVYNALAKPSPKNQVTMSSTTDPMNLSWQIETVPPKIVGFKPAAHIVINSINSPPNALLAVENIVYGIDGGPSSAQPTIAQLITIFEGFQPLPDSNRGV